MMYSLDAGELRRKSGKPITVVENDTELYWRMAVDLYGEIKAANAGNRSLKMILPVGPVFQYRRLISLLEAQPLDLSRVHWFFMDEYLDPEGRAIDPSSPLSFRGFIERELAGPLSGRFNFRPGQVHFPDPSEPGSYDRRIDELGGIDLCHAGVGINGHLAFNEPPEPGEAFSAEDFADFPSRVIRLSRETITINSNTALRGAFELIPERAVTVGMRQILSARRLELFFNRPWQGAVCRKALLLPPSASFPATLARKHPLVAYTMTEEVAAPLDFGLR
jgi:glucosamine-6-phosphate deaminase